MDQLFWFAEYNFVRVSPFRKLGKPGLHSGR